MIRHFCLWLFAAGLLTFPASAAESSLSLDAAIQKALTASPRLKAIHAGKHATEGERQQAGLWHNPEIGIEAENFAGGGAYRSFDSAEVTYGVSQRLEVGGKRGARVEAANHTLALAESDEAAARLDLIRDVTIAYMDAVAAQEAVTLTAEQESLAEEVLQAVTTRVDAAREPIIQRSKANVTMATTRIAREKAERDVIAAKLALAALWGESTVGYTLDGSAFFTITEPKHLDDMAWQRSPDYTRWESAIARNKAEHVLEKANAVPDPTIDAGIRDLRDSGDQAFVLGVSFPIPVLNRNQGNIEKTRQEIIRAESERDATGLSLRASATKAYQALETAYYQAVALHQTILPAAEEAFALSREGYGLGKFSYLEVLDAQRTLNDTRFQYHESLKDYHRSRAELERLIAPAPSTEGESHAAR